jgi:hypothetical protein
MLIISSCESTKNPYVTPPDPWLQWSKEITINREGDILRLSYYFMPGCNDVVQWQIKPATGMKTVLYGNSVSYRIVSDGMIEIKVSGRDAEGVVYSVYKRYTP